MLKELNQDASAIEKFRDAFIFEAAWELESKLEGTTTRATARKHVQTATVIFNKALGRTDYAARIGLWVTMEDVENKRKEVWGQTKERGIVFNIASLRDNCGANNSPTEISI